ncbi:MAG: hypothetical protein DRI46_10175 [Chloroflexi bacterium]|nr:MAG: hypothetical protein DRI46_10175 [Chloroflexota bacterium]
MPLETGTTIAQLIATWPLSGDFVSEGDNHLNLIKNVLKLQFPGANGQGFDTPILATEADLNFTQNTRANLQAQIDNIEVGVSNELGAPPGTTMIFFDATPPAGWTQLSANNDSMLRVVSGSGGGVGGTHSPVSHNHGTGSHVLTQAEMPLHGHGMFDSTATNGDGGLPGPFDSVTAFGDNVGNNRAYKMQKAVGGSSVGTTKGAGSDQSHNHGNTGTTTPRYINVITAVKD